MDIRVSQDPAIEAATWIERRLSDAIRRRGSATVAFSGGSTAPALLAALAARTVAWRSVTAWQVDERIASDGDRDRNANQLTVLPCRMRLMPVTARSLPAAARRYAAGLPEAFDVVHLGIGDDGHTASWPPGDDDVVNSDVLVELVPEFNGRRRMTLTPPAVNAARSRVVLATGANKRSVVERWLLRDPRLPVDRVRRSSTVVFLDHAAAPIVPMSE